MNSEIKFKNRIYKLFASLTFPPLYTYDYSDEYYNRCFKKFVGTEHGVLDIIRHGILYRYISEDDFKELKLSYKKKIRNPKYPDKLFHEFESADKKFVKFLKSVPTKNGYFTKDKIINLYQIQRELGSPLDSLLNVHHIFTLLFEEELREKIKKLARNKIEANKLFIELTKPIKKTKLSSKENIKARNFKIELPGLRGRDRIIQKMLCNGAYIKDYVEGVFFGKEKFLNNLYNQIVRLFRITRDDLLYLKRDEIIEYIKKDKKVDKKLIQDRDFLTVFYKETGGKFLTFEGSKAKNFIKRGRFKNIKKRKKPEKLLKGHVASLGKTKGKVRIILNPAQLKEFRRGEILVALYTAVEHVPAMKKANAIITETGGITSHAAVVSRELGKPCIIGVDRVTEILNTGDVIRVDANRGIIEVFSKNK